MCARRILKNKSTWEKGHRKKTFKEMDKCVIKVWNRNRSRDLHGDATKKKDEAVIRPIMKCVSVRL
jgi:hypothetical protein